MKSHTTFLKSLIKHKYYVGKACFKMGLYWQGIVHDYSKFGLTEYPRYVRRFGGGIHTGRDKSGYYDPTKDDDFKLAWLHHYKVNKHHPTYWCIIKDSTGGDPSQTTLDILDMPEKYIIEMLCDFWGASMAYRDKGPGGDIEHFWYDNRHKFRVSEKTMKYVNSNIERISKRLNGVTK